VVVVGRIAEREAMNEASQLNDQLARTVIMPALKDSLLTGDPQSFADFDKTVRERVLGDRFVRVKVWNVNGDIVYSDAAALVGRNFPLAEDKQDVLRSPSTVAEVSDLSQAENDLERQRGRLVEVYRPVWTPSGKPLLFETYSPYATVTARTADVWRAFGGIVVSSLLLFMVLMLPLLWALLDRLRRARDQREQLLRHAIDASEDERRRIAADLHDGVVQELVAASLEVARAADDLGQERLRAAAAAVRGSVGGLRTLLVDIYPRNLATAGLPAALADLATGVRARGIEVELDVDEAAVARLSEDRQRLIYRMVRECFGNTVKHSRARTAWVRLTAEPGGVVVATGDDGVGFDPALVVTLREGHLGLRLLADLAGELGATLWRSGGPGRGTRWRLVVPDGE
jgi:two-component system, NarL family, sensor kinase